jgi:glycosyltransferase involved in cell wall biosynthesis
VVINAADPEIFHPDGRVSFSHKRKIRLISMSWSDNPNKGGALYQWLDGNLDWSRFEYTFVGRVKAVFQNIQLVPPVSSQEVASLLRNHDIFITASKNDPCSNALIEALACGLPAIYRYSGGHPEIVGKAGLGFSAVEEIPGKIAQLIAEYEERQSMISIPDIQVVAQQYLEIMDIEPQDK